MITPAIIVHGGAGRISESRYPGKNKGCQAAARVGYEVLRQTDNPVEAVEAAIKVMELDGEFNAGNW